MKSEAFGFLIEQAMESFNSAVAGLSKVVDLHIEKNHKVVDSKEEVQRLASESANLARSLDEAETRAKCLAETNREVSHRLVKAMELVRVALDKQLLN
ncbi:DUF4164 family protein [Candidatus Endowatersipora endosymbiont of Watersipora subatra]|uniref:DUF4164 family protein n=1 Tax=Candidatus Endowatersipora endosymbiont of Watersipora subatra TaxID=3077946 RepID=UPI00312C8517